MTPDFRLTADSKDVTAAVKDRLVSLRVRDEAGMKSDTLELVLDDRAPVVALPASGAALELWLGYRPALAPMGRWTVDEVGASGWPARLTVRARAADLLESIKARRERSWPAGTTLWALVQTISAEHGLVPMFAAELSGVVLPHIDQTESDLHLLTRLARDLDAVAKPAGGRLIFVPRALAKSASGQALPAVALAAGDLTAYELTVAERGKYAAVEAQWHDPAAGERVPVRAGPAEGKPVFTLGQAYPDAQSARRAAEARLAALTRGAGTLRLTCPGDPRLVAEARLTVSGVRSGVDGAWSATAVEHVLDAGGYRCEVEAETPREPGAAAPAEPPEEDAP